MDFFKGFSCSNSPGVGCLFGTFKKALHKMTHLLSEKPFFGAKLFLFRREASLHCIESYQEKLHSSYRTAGLPSPNILTLEQEDRVLSSEKLLLSYQ